MKLTIALRNKLVTLIKDIVSNAITFLNFNLIVP